MIDLRWIIAELKPTTISLQDWETTNQDKESGRTLRTTTITKAVKGSRKPWRVKSICRIYRYKS